MPRLAITVSDALLADLDAIAERDAPGAPNRSGTGLRLLALGIAQEKASRPPPPVADEYPPEQSAAFLKALESRTPDGIRLRGLMADKVLPMRRRGLPVVLDEEDRAFLRRISGG